MGFRVDVAALVLSLLVLGCWWSIGGAKDFWYGEQFVVEVASRPVGEELTLLKYENNPPLYFALSEAWSAVAGHTERALRVFTVLATAAGVTVLWSWARKLYGVRAAATIALLAATSGMVAVQSIEYRMYALVFLWSCCALALAERYVAGPKPRTLLLLALVHTLGLYTHYTYLPVIIATSAWMYMVKPRSRGMITVSLASISVIFLPWALYSLLPILRSVGQTIGIQRESGTIMDTFLAPVTMFLPYRFNESVLVTIARVLGSVSILVVMIRSWRGLLAEKQWRTSPVSLAVLIVVVTMIFLVATRFFPLKYATAMLPSLLLLMTYGLMQLRRSSLLSGCLVTIFMIVSFGHIRAPAVTYRSAAKLIEQQSKPGDLVLVHPFNDDIVVRRYLKSERVVGLFPDKAPGGATLLDNVEKNFQPQITRDNVGQLAQFVGTANRVWFIYDVTPEAGPWQGQLVHQWFVDQGFTAQLHREIFQNTPPLVVEYNRSTVQ